MSSHPQGIANKMKDHKVSAIQIVGPTKQIKKDRSEQRKSLVLSTRRVPCVNVSNPTRSDATDAIIQDLISDS